MRLFVYNDWKNRTMKNNSIILASLLVRCVLLSAMDEDVVRDSVEMVVCGQPSDGQPCAGDHCVEESVAALDAALKPTKPFTIYGELDETKISALGCASVPVECVSTNDDKSDSQDRALSTDVLAAAPVLFEPRVRSVGRNFYMSTFTVHSREYLRYIYGFTRLDAKECAPSVLFVPCRCPWPCCTVVTEFTEYNELDAHFRNCHLINTRLKKCRVNELIACPDCEKVCYACQLMQHLFLKHVRRRQFQCNRCRKFFASKKGCDDHVKRRCRFKRPPL